MTLITKHALPPLRSLIGPLIGPDTVLHLPMASSCCLPLSFVRSNIEDVTCPVNTLLPLTYQLSLSQLQPSIAALITHYGKQASIDAAFAVPILFTCRQPCT